MQISDNIALSNMIDTKVYTDQGTEAGVIEEVLIDPSAGIVRFTIVKMGAQSLCLPWAAMVLNKAKGGYTLTHLGTSIYQDRLNS